MTPVMGTLTGTLRICRRTPLGNGFVEPAGFAPSFESNFGAVLGTS
jgi:hypothetical protein